MGSGAARGGRKRAELEALGEVLQQASRDLLERGLAPLHLRRLATLTGEPAHSAGREAGASFGVRWTAPGRGLIACHQRSPGAATCLARAAWDLVAGRSPRSLMSSARTTLTFSGPASVVDPDQLSRLGGSARG